MKKTVLAITVALISTASYAQMKPEDAIQTRQAGYKFMGWNMGKIKGQVVDAPETYNKDQVLNAARAIAGIANSGMGVLYVPGSDKEVNGVKTKVKPELFTDGEGVKKVAVAFMKEANELAKVAESGDAASIKVQFGKLGAACKECHDNYRNK
jgi:cytochrome c556